MKFTTSSKTLLQTCLKASAAVGTNPVLPILESLKFEVKNNQLTVTGSDLEITCIATCEVMGTDGTICIPAKILVDTLKALPESPITLEVGENNLCTITSSNGKYKMPGENATDFPQAPQMDTTPIFSFQAGEMLEAVNRVGFAASSDELRPAMCGIYMEKVGGELTFTATDAHRLANYSSTQEAADFAPVILSKRFFVALKNLLSGNSQGQMFTTKDNVCAEMPGLRIVGRLVDARYPDWRNVVPKDNPITARLNRLAFAAALRRVSIFSNKNTNQVILNFQNDNLTISAADLDFSNEGVEQLDCKLAGAPLEIGFNGRFALEALNAFQGDEITIEMSTASRAGIMRCEGESLFVLVMPVMLNN